MSERRLMLATGRALRKSGGSNRRTKIRAVVVRPSKMKNRPERCALPTVLVVAAALVGCGGQAKTDLSIHVANGFGQQEYRLTCNPAGGDVPRPKELCALLANNADVMLLRPPDKSTCIGGLGTVHLRVRGDFNGRKVDATEIDACQGNGEAELLWRSQLPPPPTW
jgi:Subtilisin inhibitor-like